MQCIGQTITNKCVVYLNKLELNL